MKLRKQYITILSFILIAGVGFAQDFIGCLTDSGWAETPMLSKSFVIEGDDFDKRDYDSLSFYVDIVSLGYHELFINGTRVGNDVLQPSVCQLNKRAFKLTYDITSLLRVGNNEVMLWLGQGWGRIYGTPAVAKVNVYQSVSSHEQELVTTFVKSDSSWEVTPSGYSYTGSWQPLQFGGERYDARVRPDWRPASVYQADGITVSMHEFGGNHIVDVLKPIAITEQDNGSILLDFGRVATGWFKADFPQMPEGTEVMMEYLDHINARPPHTEKDIYIARGYGEEKFSNRFHTHSFRYVRIASITPHPLVSHSPSIPLQHSSFSFQVISAVDSKNGATFWCNDERLNAIHNLVKHTLSCLTFSGYMVDCPHLERMGYGGDGNSSTMTLQTIWDVRDTYRNWMTAWKDAMESDGELPYVAPAFRTGGGPYWSSFIVQAPWHTYLNYGDRYLIVEYYNTMKRWLEFIESNETDGLLQPWPDNERHAWFLGDWLAPEGVDIGGESVLHVSNCVISECLADMEQIANALSRYNEAQYYAEWRQKLNSVIHKAFYHPESHTYANGTPLDQAYALLMDIPPDSSTAEAVKTKLLSDIHVKYRDHVAFGLVGVPVFTEWCIRDRQTDIMATMLRQPDYPGYLNMINNGATTTWESWDCGRPGKEDRSRVHNCYNGIGIWFYQALAGIRPDPKQPGYKHFFVDPQPCKGITHIRATKPTLYGTIQVDIDDSKLKIVVPQGTTATVFPNSRQERTLVSGEWELEINEGRER